MNRRSSSPYWPEVQTDGEAFALAVGAPGTGELDFLAFSLEAAVVLELDEVGVGGVVDLCLLLTGEGIGVGVVVFPVVGGV